MGPLCNSSDRQADSGCFPGERHHYNYPFLNEVTVQGKPSVERFTLPPRAAGRTSCIAPWIRCWIDLPRGDLHILYFTSLLAQSGSSCALVRATSTHGPFRGNYDMIVVDMSPLPFKGADVWSSVADAALII